MYGGSGLIQGGLSQHRQVLIGNEDKNQIELSLLIDKSRVLIQKAIPSDNPTETQLDYNHIDYNPKYYKYIKEAAFLLVDEKIEAEAAQRTKEFKINLSGSDIDYTLYADKNEYISHINKTINNIDIFYISLNYRVININTITKKIISLTSIKGIANVITELVVDLNDICGIDGSKCPNIKEGLNIFLELKNNILKESVEEIGNITMSNDMMIQKYKKISDVHIPCGSLPITNSSIIKGHGKKKSKKSKKKLN